MRNIAVLLVAVVTLTSMAGEARSDERVCYSQVECTPDAMVCECPTQAKKRKRRKKRVAVSPPAVQGPAGVKGDRGPQGPAGPRGPEGRPGRDGSTKVTHILVRRHVGARLGLGYLGLVLGPTRTGGYAYGGSLRLVQPVGANYDVSVEVAWAPGRAGAVVGRVGLTRWLTPNLGVTTGAVGVSMGTKEDEIDATYATGYASLTLAKEIGPFEIRGDVGPTVGYAWYDGADDGILVGGVGSVGVGFSW